MFSETSFWKAFKKCVKTPNETNFIAPTKRLNKKYQTQSPSRTTSLLILWKSPRKSPKMNYISNESSNYQKISLPIFVTSSPNPPASTAWHFTKIKNFHFSLSLAGKAFCVRSDENSGKFSFPRSVNFFFARFDPWRARGKIHFKRIVSF